MFPGVGRQIFGMVLIQGVPIRFDYFLFANHLGLKDVCL